MTKRKETMVKVDLASSRLRREDGQTMAEYSVVISVITLAVVAVFGFLSGGIEGAITTVIGLIPS